MVCFLKNNMKHIMNETAILDLELNYLNNDEYKSNNIYEYESGLSLTLTPVFVVMNLIINMITNTY